jgi:endoglucanase
MDQVGFLVSHIGAQGTLRVHPVGSFDPRVLYACRVVVCASSGDDLPGVMSPLGRPIHTASPEELRRVPEIADVVVDLGLPAEVVHRKVKLGDMIVFDTPFAIAGDAVVTAGLDDRAGCWAVLAALKQLERHACEIYAVFSVQEELGSRGAGPASFGIEPDIGIACDTIVCCDLPDIPSEQHITRAGQGVAIQIADSSTISDPRLVDAVEKIADRASIPCQRSLMLGGGQDGALIQRSRAGVRTLVLSCPVRYLHTPTEMAFVKDLESYRDLLAAMLREL